jgi:hypothetical protein
VASTTATSERPVHRRLARDQAGHRPQCAPASCASLCAEACVWGVAFSASRLHCSPPNTHPHPTLRPPAPLPPGSRRRWRRASSTNRSGSAPTPGPAWSATCTTGTAGRRTIRPARRWAEGGGIAAELVSPTGKKNEGPRLFLVAFAAGAVEGRVAASQGLCVSWVLHLPSGPATLPSSRASRRPCPPPLVLPPPALPPSSRAPPAGPAPLLSCLTPALPLLRPCAPRRRWPWRSDSGRSSRSS